MSTEEPASATPGDASALSEEDMYMYLVCDLTATLHLLFAAGHQYTEFSGDARGAGYSDVADYFDTLMQEDAGRIQRIADILDDLRAPGGGGPIGARKKFPRPHGRHR
jgi:hypothetical protein